MNTQPTPPTVKRRRAVPDRLRVLTAGVAVAGVAATAGIGFLAASGTVAGDAEPTAAGMTGSAPETGAAIAPEAPFLFRELFGEHDGEHDDDDGRPAHPGSDEGFVRPDRGTVAAPGAASGGGHATTGGS